MEASVAELVHEFGKEQRFVVAAADAGRGLVRRQHAGAAFGTWLTVEA